MPLVIWSSISVLATEFISMDQFSEDRINSEYMFAYATERLDF